MVFAFVVGADAHADAANSASADVFIRFHMLRAAARIEDGFARFAVDVIFARDRFCGASVFAYLTITAAALDEGLFCRKRHICEDGGKTDLRPVFGRDEESVFADEPQTCKHRGFLVGKNAAVRIFIGIGALRCSDGKSREAFAL